MAILNVPLESVARMVEASGSQKLKVLAQLLRNMDLTDNICGITYRELAEQTGCSKKTVGVGMRYLISSGMVAKIRNGLYMINPRIAHLQGVSIKKLEAEFSRLSGGKADKS